MTLIAVTKGSSFANFANFGNFAKPEPEVTAGLAKGGLVDPRRAPRSLPFVSEKVVEILSTLLLTSPPDRFNVLRLEC